MWFAPFDKQLDLPSASVQVGAGRRRNDETVGQEIERAARLGVAVFDPAQGLRAVAPGCRAGRRSGRTRREQTCRCRVDSLGR